MTIYNIDTVYNELDDTLEYKNINFTKTLNSKLRKTSSRQKNSKFRNPTGIIVDMFI